MSFLFRIICFTGIIGSDDLGYAKYARQIAQGTYHLYPHHYAIRYGVIVPLAVVYRLFGVHEWTTIALPLIASSITPALLLLITARLFPGCGHPWIAGLLLASFPADVHYATIMVPEPLMQATLSISILLFLESESRNNARLAMLAGVGFGCSYLTKEPALFVALAVVLWSLVRGNGRLAAAMAGGLMLLMGCESFWYYSQSRDFMFRAHAMGVHNHSPEVLDANANLRDRLISGYPRMMLLPNLAFGLHSMLALSYGAVASVIRRLHTQPAFLFAVLCAALPFLYLDFGSSSLNAYMALPIAPRYVSFVYPSLFCLVAVLMPAVSKKATSARLLAMVLVLAVCMAGFWCAFTTRDSGYSTSEVRHLKTLIALGPQAAPRFCASLASGESRCLETVQMLQP